MASGPVAGGGARRTTTIVAFTSLTGGIGRTGVVVNLAWVLTMAGKRVAIADWGTEWPRAHDYLAPFPADHIPPRVLLGDAVVDFLVSSGPSTIDGSVFPLPEARRYWLPDGHGHIDVAAAWDLTAPVPGFAPDRSGGREIE